ncbi:triose-phosphate isomerase [Alkalilacustris brevis]|uniref:triose-phosphate isomerase n=1 Tax=Alkalilacustris brevis TaxID=2026338 RepID=UPI000E0D7F26|nr:triose-phosphate isomerase [Alkalilacustris brevis]
MRRKLIAGNWKMHGLADRLAEAEKLSEAYPDPACEVVLCPPATLISRMWEVLLGGGIRVGAQDCHPAEAGAHTGDISAAMLADAGASHVIVGHSERRADHHETDALIAAKLHAAHGAGLVAILCLGETGAERDAGAARDVVTRQLEAALPAGARAKDTVIAYEPVWAIGSGRTPTPAQIAEVHGTLRAALQRLVPDQADGMRLLYGGSVKPANAAEILAITDVDGALVGGASLDAVDFSAIIAAAEALS